MAISVIITTFNRAALLQSTLQALRAQHYEPGDELIVVDNASTDHTFEVIDRAATRFPISVRYLKELRRGKSPALNSGIATAHGEILALTDDDVIVAEDWIETIRRLFQDPSLVLAGGRVDPWWERPAPNWLRLHTGADGTTGLPAFAASRLRRGKPRDRATGRPTEDVYGTMASPLALLNYGDAQPLGNRTAVGANLAVRRWAVDALGGFAPELGRRIGTLLCGEDHDLCQRAVAAGYRCEYRPELRVRHWVPEERLQLRYYLRWFFWSGITNAVLERHPDAGSGETAAVPAIPRYHWGELARAPGSVLAALLKGGVPAAVERVMNVAFVLGYVRQRLTDRWMERKLAASSSQLPAPSFQLPASSCRPAANRNVPADRAKLDSTNRFRC